MPRFAANLSVLYNEHPFLDRFAAAAADGEEDQAHAEKCAHFFHSEAKTSASGFVSGKISFTGTFVFT